MLTDVILIPCLVESIKSRRDNTIAITIGTQELPPAKVGEIYGLQNKYSFVMLKPSEFTKSEVDIAATIKVDPDDQGKTKSQRLRAVLYRLWEQQPDGHKEFDTFYSSRMEQLITSVKSRLE